VRRGFDVIRSVDVLIWALIWINVVGLGRRHQAEPHPVQPRAARRGDALRRLAVGGLDRLGEAST
jgi:hypothetical protein